MKSDDRAEQAVSRAQVYETSLRVRYAETDQMGVVYHSNYIIWFEVGRVEMFRQLGFTYSEMEEQDGIHVVVVEARCRFKAPARYDDLIGIRTRLLNVRDSLLHFGYEIVRARLQQWTRIPETNVLDCVLILSITSDVRSVRAGYAVS